MIRPLAATLSAVALLLVLAVPTLAGGWAEIVADAQTIEPVEGQPTEVGFTVLQHGQTPAPWESATVHFVNASTGETIDVVASNDRADGHFVAAVTLPVAGYWSWQVTLRDLASDHLPVTMAVETAAGIVPTYDPSTTVTAIARAKREVTDDLGARFFPAIERLDATLLAQQSKIDRLLEQTNAITAERDALATRLAAAENGGVSALAILTLAALAGATAGFAMTWLAGRPGSRAATLSQAPQGADPA